MIYILIWLFLFIGNLLKKNKVFFKFGIFFLILLSFFRYNIGWDYYSYKEILETLIENYNYDRFEPINKLIIQFARKINIIPIYFGIYAILSIYLIKLFIKKNSKDIMLSLFLFYNFDFGFISSLSTIRSFLAISILCFGLDFIYKKQLLKYLIIVLVATLVHASAIIGIIFYILYHIRLNFFYYLLFWIAFLHIEKLLLIIPFFYKYKIYFQLYESSKYMRYIMLAYAIIPLILILFLKNKKLKLLNTIIFIGGIIGYKYIENPGLNRISNYFLIYLLIYIPNLINEIRNVYFKIILKGITILFTSLMFFYLLNIHYKSEQNGKIIPYKTFLGEQIKINK